ncbi:SpoIIE family protein phosphatase [Actinokineospora sp. PR83]|uniref:SpoIIE family protein phosphatase n=1 Tax=Actinokineospora sp. PR83 TaxID=2884908 RepID=UPI001F20FC2B|nr:SpoIIE family protein phosphatase [Actinokineospora sp. PR83]MCG8914271.1 SpoIIE family protein phosphatase [Actinokineospora sp. PR83]
MAVEHEGERIGQPFTGSDPVTGLLAAVDWAGTPLGPAGDWHPQLRSVVRTMISSRQQMVLFWGPERIAVYNDAYAPTIGDKHPRALGRPAEENWGELWEVLAPLLDRVHRTGTPFWAQDHPFPIERHGFLEQTYFDVSYDPVFVDDPVGGDGAVYVGGVLCLVTETTGRVLGERRMRALGRLGTLLTGLSDTERIGRVTATALADDPEDVPRALLYLLDGEQLVLAGAVHRESAPLTVNLVGPDPVVEVLRTVFADGEAAWLPEPPGGGARALALPLTSLTGVGGVLVAVPNPMLDLSSGYREFLDLVAAAVSAALANAATHDAERARIESLAELDRAKTELFANVSHELRTPLTLIAGPAEDALADADEPLPPTHRERVEVIRRNAARLVRMVENILDFTRIESGSLRAEPGATDLSVFTAAIADSFRPAVERAGLELRVDTPPLPREVAVDRDMWQRVVLNLLSNALKFTLSGSIEVAVADLDGRAVLTVADTGLGIPAQELPRLFDRFHRVREPAARSREGTGIGLALAAELVHLHSGDIHAASEPGVGTTFTVTLPYGEAPAATATPARGAVAEAYLDEALGWSGGTSWVEALPQTDPRATGGSRVLVVEDNADLRGFLVRLLSRHWEVAVAANGDEALTAVRRGRPDLVLTDVLMPGLDGYGLLAALRGNPSTEHIPVILLSARAGEEAAIEGLAAGADDYLSKPFSAQELVARVRSNLELARLRSHQAAWRAALVESLDDGFFMMDAAGTILEMNAACGQILGFDARGLPYPRPYPWWPVSEVDPRAAQRLEDALDQALAGGGGRFEVPARRDTGRRVWLAVSVNEVPPLGTGPKLFVGTVRDVTSDRVAAERDAALATFAAALADATDVGEVLAAGSSGLGGAWSTRPAVAVAWVRGSEGSDTRGDRPEVVADADGRGWDDLPAHARSALAAAQRTRTPQVVPEPGADRRSLGIAARLDAAGEETAVWLELDPPQRVSDVDRFLFGSLCAQLGLALTRARSFDEQRTVAVTLQRSILGPTDLPDGFAVRYEPALEPLEVGGDWYDVVRLDEHRVGVVVGDCVGRGLRAASVMGQLRSACRALLQQAIDPAQVLTALDDFAELLPGATCTTVFCAIVDDRAGTLVYSSAGHLPGLVAGRGGRTSKLDGASSVPLAVRGTGARPQATVDLEDGCTVLLYTDGLVERRGEVIDDGIDRAVRALVEAGDAPTLDEALHRVITGLAPEHGHDDDVAALLYRHTAGGM